MLTQSRVIDAAELLFHKVGFTGTTVRGIADAAAVSVGTVMAVGDKQALLVRVFDRIIEAEHDARTLDRLAPQGAVVAEVGVPDACPDRLVALTAPFVSLFTQHDDLARVYASILVSGGHDSQLFADLAARLTEEFRTVITERGCTSGDEAAVKSAALYFAYVGLLFTASARRTADSDALSSDLRGAFAAICACKE